MFKQKDYQYFEFSKKQIDEYTIESGSQLSLQVFSRDGFKLIDILGGGFSGGQNESSSSNSNTVSSSSNSNTYLVNNDGFVKLPVLGEFYVKGYSEKELSNLLSQKYASLFVDPYVILKVVNRRVFVFKGGSASVVSLNESPTSLIEILAKSGGLEKTLKAYKIKVIRGDIKNPQIQLVDLSTLEGVRKADLTLEPNDIVYVEEKKRIFRDVFYEISPIFSIIGSVATLVLLIERFGK